METRVLGYDELNSLMLSGEKQFTDMIFKDEIMIDSISGELVFKNCVFKKSFSIEGIIEESDIQFLDSIFMDDLCVTMDMIKRSRLSFEGCKVLNDKGSGMNFRVDHIHNSKIKIGDSEIRGGIVEIANTTLHDSLFQISRSQISSGMNVNRVRIEKGCLDFHGTEISGDRIVFKNIYAGDSAVDFFGSKLEAGDIIFDTLTFINSNMYFDPDKKIRDGNVAVDDDGEIKTKLISNSLIFEKLRFQNSNILFKECLLNTIFFTMRDSQINGDFRFKDIDMGRAREFRLFECLFSGVAARFSNVFMYMGEFYLENTTFDGRLELSKLRFKKMIIKELDVNSNVKWNISDILKKNVPEKLFLNKGDEFDHKGTLINLRNAMKLLDKEEREEEYNFLYYWSKKIEEDSVLKSAKGVRKLLYKVHYLYYGRMTDYLLNWRKVIQSIRSVIFVSAGVYCITGMLDNIFRWLYSGMDFGSFFGVENVFQFVYKGLGFCLQKLYFSCITFTTVGYGDIHPDALSKPVACLEGLLGIFLCGALIASLGKKFKRELE